MKSLGKVFVLAIVSAMFFGAIAYAGQNSGAGIRFDLNSSTAGNQNQTSIPPPAVGSTIYVDVYVVAASNLDTYEFDVNYDASKLNFVGAYADAHENSDLNILESDGGTAIGWIVDPSVSGVVNIAYSLVGDNPAEAPEGEGLIGCLRFTVTVSPPGELSFGYVAWWDNGGNKDECTDKGGDASLPVELSSFSAEVGDGIVILRWVTESEVDNLGFNIYRSRAEDGDYRQITSELIPGAGNSAYRNEYEYVDKGLTNGVTYWYKLEDVDYDGNKSLHGPVSATPTENIRPTVFQLSQNYPNPFNPTTVIKYQLPEESWVTLSIYNTQGQLVRTLVESKEKAGYKSVSWDGRDSRGSSVASGVYLYVLKVDQKLLQTRKMAVIR